MGGRGAPAFSSVETARGRDSKRRQAPRLAGGVQDADAVRTARPEEDLQKSSQHWTHARFPILVTALERTIQEGNTGGRWCGNSVPLAPFL